LNAGALVDFPAERDEAECAAPAKPRAACVRPFNEDDLEAVAHLFLQRFRSGGAEPRRRAEIAQCMKALYLDHPSREGEADALVATDASGAIGAFCGGVRTRFAFDGQPASVCVTGTLMASPEPQHALAAVQILRESRKLDYDLIVTDSANRASLAMCQAMGYQVASTDSLEWACVFDPVSLALHKIAQRFGQRWLGALKPVARAADLAASAALRAAAGPPKKSDWRDEAVDEQTFVDIAPRFLAPYRLRPDLSREELLWHVAMARQRRSAGPLQLQVVYDGAGEPAAAYAAFGGKGDVARVFHAVAAPHAWGRLFDKMCETARARGCIGVHGSLKRAMTAHAYATRGVFFYYAGGLMTFTRRPEIRRAIESGDAFLGGFAGDRWTRLASDTFG
jgi:hypothetical protein